MNQYSSLIVRINKRLLSSNVLQVR